MLKEILLKFSYPICDCDDSNHGFSLSFKKTKQDEKFFLNVICAKCGMELNVPWDALQIQSIVKIVVENPPKKKQIITVIPTKT